MKEPRRTHDGDRGRTSGAAVKIGLLPTGRQRLDADVADALSEPDSG